MKRDAGLTLIELVAVMAVFALIAVMGLQSLTGMLRNRDRLAEIDANTTALTMALTRLRNDVSATVPMLFFPPQRQPPRSALRHSGDTFALSIGGQAGFDGVPDRHRVQWRLDPSTQRLHRRVWTALTPADATAQHPEVLVMEGVTDMQLRSFWHGTGWSAGLTNPATQTQEIEVDGDTSGGAPEVYSDVLPVAIEITLITETHGPITMIEAFR